MTTYTQTFGGSTIYPAAPSYLALTLTANVSLSWPLEASASATPAASTVDITSTSAVYNITLPDATMGGTGAAFLFNSLSASTQDTYIKDAAGNTLATVSTGTQWMLYLASNATTAGVWRAFRFGASTATVSAAALAGYGITATSGLLSQSHTISSINSSPRTVTANDRAFGLIWTGSGAGTYNLTAAATLGNNFFFMVRNAGGGDLTIDPSGAETINGAATITLSPGDSAIIVTDGASWYSVGLGASAVFAFDFTAISLAAAGATYTLAGAELNRIAYKFTGLLTNNVEVRVPSTVQQYWVDNRTTGAFTVKLNTSTGTAVTVNQGSRGIFYCDGASVVNADTASISVPIAATDGGTGQTGYTTGDLLYANSGTTIAKLADVATGNALISGGVGSAPAYGKVGLTTHVSGTLPVANGGTGVTTVPTNGQLPIGNGTNYVAATLTAGTGISITNGAGSITVNSTTSGTVTSVDVSGGTTGLTASGGPITTAGTITLAGTLIAANGGTGQTTYAVGDLLYASTTSALSKLADVATGNALISGGVGVAPSYGKIGLATHVSGTLGTGNGGTGSTSTTYCDLTANVANALPVANGGTALTSYTTGDVLYASAAGVLSKLADVATGNALISGGVGVAPSYGKIGLTTHVSGALGTGNGGTGLTGTPTNGQLAIGNGSGFALAAITAGAGISVTNGAGTITIAASGSGGTVTSVDGSGGATGLTLTGGPITASGTLTLGGTLVAANGGTGQSSYAVGDLLYASTTSALSKLADVATGSALISGGIGAAPSYGKIGLATHVSGTLPIGNGGTGLTGTATNGQLLIGNGSGFALAAITAGSGITVTNGAGTITIASTASGGTVTSVDVSGGSTGFTFSGSPVTTSGTMTMSGTLGAGYGGTGLSSFTTGDIMYASSGSTLAKLADVATGSVLLSGGVGLAPSYGKVTLTTCVTGVLPIANGGTNATTAGGALSSLGAAASGANADITSMSALASVSSQVAFAGAATSTNAVAFSATAMVIPCASSNVFATTFTANVTTAPTFTNNADGQTINWFITQDATGSRTMTWPTSFKWAGGVAGVLSTAANAVDLLVATYRSSTGFWYASLSKAFA